MQLYVQYQRHQFDLRNYSKKLFTLPKKYRYSFEKN